MKNVIGESRVAGFNAGVLWLDENFDILSIDAPGNNNSPTPVMRPDTGLFYAGFPNIGVSEQFLHKEYNHDAIILPKGGVNPQIRPHVHFSPVSAAAGNVKWFFEYFIHSGSVSTSGTLSIVVSAGGVAWQEQIVEIGVIEFPAPLQGITGIQIGGRLYRDPSDPEDTYGATVAITDTAGWHYPVDSDGSIGIFAKYG